MTKQPTKVGKSVVGKELVSHHQSLYEGMKARNPSIYTRDGPSQLLMTIWQKKSTIHWSTIRNRRFDEYCCYRLCGTFQIRYLTPNQCQEESQFVIQQLLYILLFLCDCETLEESSGGTHLSPNPFTAQGLRVGWIVLGECSIQSWSNDTRESWLTLPVLLLWQSTAARSSSRSGWSLAALDFTVSWMFNSSGVECSDGGFRGS